jgi:hypothetical protein
MSVASLLILMGGAPGDHDEELVAGATIALVVFVAALYLALRGLPGKPAQRSLLRPMVGLAAFYALCALAAGTAGPAYALAGLLAGVIPLTALALMVATARTKTDDSDGRLRDLSADADDDPFPGIGLDDETPLGASPEHARGGRSSPRR